ncbi:MAG: glycoside hydrolase [Bacteroidetes bacterium]|nr:glycoside hydrolase [Bacteroidota bacterium]
MTKLINLEGRWKFTIGDDMAWAGKNSTDDHWDEIKVPGNWEDNGYYGYNGFAWYRKTFDMPASSQNMPLFLILGYIDDVDEVFFNGTKIGMTGSFPPHFSTAYTALRKYYIPGNLINYNGKNTISVRVYDTYMYGGIVKGDIGIFTYKNSIPTDISLLGPWKFNTGDHLQWSEPGFDDSHWTELFVPAYWENQGYRDYDGFAWYRRKVFVSGHFSNDPLVLILGKIDDLDEVYINGILIGSTGKIYDNPGKIHVSEEYRAMRGYYIPRNVIRFGAINTIAVRIYDALGEGGIYEGNIGLVRQTRYINYWRKNRR